MRKHLILVFILGIALLMSAVLPAQQGAGQTELQSPSVIRVSTNLVTVPVSVTDASGHVIENLGKDDFVIKEDGNTETIARIAEAGQSPLQLALLFDLSGSV